MKKWTNILAIALLLFNGLGALYGGGNLMLYPDGSGFGMPLSLLAHTPFRNFLIPGSILFVANGLSSMVVVTALLLKVRYASRLVIAQGAILIGWIVVQVVLIQGLSFLHVLFSVVGIVLIIAGWMQTKHIDV